VSASEFDGLTYEQLVARLEELTTRMAAGDIGIEEAADLYEEAGRLHDQAAARLARVQERIDQLRKPADGNTEDLSPRQPNS
jgi:exodeoxyribonuclease VII small subunit